MSKYKYVSIDIETLGLDPETCDIIEFGAVLDDLESPLETLPAYHTYLVKKDNLYCGQPFAMSMHPTILHRIAKREGGYTYMYPHQLDQQFNQWLSGKGVVGKIVIAGKNFANFDLQFLKKIGFGSETQYHHRILDLGSLFFEVGKDIIPPDSKECMRRANVDGEVAHTAVEDALAVVRCIRTRLPKPEKSGRDDKIVHTSEIPAGKIYWKENRFSDKIAKHHSYRVFEELQDEGPFWTGEEFHTEQEAIRYCQARVQEPFGKCAMFFVVAPDGEVIKWQK